MSKATNPSTRNGQSTTPALQVPAAVANPFSTALANIAKKGSATAKAAEKAVEKAVSAKAVDNIAPVGVATRNAGQATTIPGFALVGLNGRKQPLASSVTAQIWLAAMAHQLGNNGGMPTQAHIKLACPTVNPTSCGLGLTQYKAYTGQVKGSTALTVDQLKALATVVAAK
jgi:hypothetical protein